jgi:FtsH-binding integral membrane protein
MTITNSRSQLWAAASATFIAAMLLFVVTIVIGILNGLDLYEPDHDTLITHVHAGTLGWITLAVGGTALLMFSRDRVLAADEVRRATMLAWSLIGAITLYVAAFFAGDRIPGDRLPRPIVGTLLFIVTIWFFVWLLRQNKEYRERSVARLGLLLSWVALLVGAVLGVTLGIYTARGEVPGLGNDTAARIAEAHPPAMVIGYLILAAMAVIEWLLRGDRRPADDRAGAIQMWLLFVAGVVINIAFISGLEEELAGPANLLMIIGVVMMVVRYRRELAPAGWRDAGTGIYPRLATLFLVVYLVLGTILIVRIVSGEMDFDALRDWEEGLVLAFDHSMFIGVMTLSLFGVVSSQLHGATVNLVDRAVAWGVTIGVAGFAVGLIAVSAPLKRTFTPLMGVVLLYGIVTYVPKLWRSRSGLAVR